VLSKGLLSSARPRLLGDDDDDHIVAAVVAAVVVVLAAVHVCAFFYLHLRLGLSCRDSFQECQRIETL
jgi:hypothetical protein